MNKVTKGAIATGVGVLLLVGGGGTLAVWNQQVNASAGVVTAGNLDLAADQGTWSSNFGGAIPEISDYRVVPGEILTYTQLVDVTLEGRNISANLVAGATDEGTTVDGIDPFDAGNISVSQVSLTKGGVGIANPLTASVEDITAQITFAFDKDATVDREDVHAKYNLGGVAFTLTQNAPTATP